jgi:outer membrane biosynthesis protein TonB
MERFFLAVQFITVTVFFIIGGILYNMGSADLLLEPRPEAEAIQTTFVMEEEKKPEPKKEPPKPKPKPAEEKKIDPDIPIDLTEKPKIEEKKEDAPPPPPAQEEKPQERPPVRQVYGLKKVFSQGLGAGGDAQNAIVGKLGNTIDKDYDTLTATKADLKGKPGAQQAAPAAPQATASAASVTKYPRLKAGFRNIKPQYSKEMLQNKVEGAVKARLLIGADGTVKKVEILEDIGYDSAEIARNFLMTLQFDPAMKGEDAVSVWIPFSIRFELI